VTPMLDYNAYIFLGVTAFFPFCLLLFSLPLFSYIDKQRQLNTALVAQNKSDRNVVLIRNFQGKKILYKRWIHYGSTEFSLCFLSLAMLITVATSKPPNTVTFIPYFYNLTVNERHSYEMLGMIAAVMYIVSLFLMLIYMYNRQINASYKTEVISGLTASATLVAPALYFAFFRMGFSTT